MELKGGGESGRQSRSKLETRVMWKTALWKVPPC